jgi:iron-sulfur cluster assembly protein
MEDLVLESGIKKGISLTPSAISEIKRLIATQNITEGQGLRLGVKGGGCAGFTYLLDFDNQQADDLVYEVEGVKILVNPMHELYLAGTEVHFEAGLNNRGFIYRNPNASKTCGCGESFG